MKNQIIVKENKQGKKLLFNVHVPVYEFLCFYYSRSRTQPQSSARLGSGSSQKSSAPVLNKLPKSLKKTLFVPRVKEDPLSVPGFLHYVQHLAGCRDSNPSCFKCNVQRYICLRTGLLGVLHDPLL